MEYSQYCQRQVQKTMLNDYTPKRACRVPRPRAHMRGRACVCAPSTTPRPRSGAGGRSPC